MTDACDVMYDDVYKSHTNWDVVFSGNGHICGVFCWLEWLVLDIVSQ